MIDLDAVRAAHPIVETVRAAGVVLVRSGARWRGRCPFHEDRDPSLVLYPETASWFCYGCRVGGDVIDFVSRFEGRPFKDTLELLGQDAAQLPANVTRFPARRRAEPLDADQQAAIECAVGHYARTLTKYRDVRAYLTSRAISVETARRMRLGYAAGGLLNALQRAGVQPRIAERLGLIADGREAMSGRLVVPDLDAEGRATWLVGRRLVGRGPRYLNLRTSTPLLGLAQARLVGTEAVVVVEGPFDWLTLCDWGIPSVALLGTHASRTALEALSGFGTAYLALDADGAGQRAAQEIAGKLGRRARPVRLPASVQDLNDLGQRRGGHEAFLRALADARSRKEAAWQVSRSIRTRAA